MKSSKSSRKRVSKKIEYLIGEGKPADQAVAMALSMEREGRLADSGAYIPVKKRVKKASINDKEKSIVHFMLDGNNLEYIEEFHIDSAEDTAISASNIIKNYSDALKSKPFYGKNNNHIVMLDKFSKSNMPNVFLFNGFSEQEIIKIGDILKI